MLRLERNLSSVFVQLIKKAECSADVPPSIGPDQNRDDCGPALGASQGLLQDGDCFFGLTVGDQHESQVPQGP